MNKAVSDIVDVGRYSNAYRQIGTIEHMLFKAGLVSFVPPDSEVLLDKKHTHKNHSDKFEEAIASEYLRKMFKTDNDLPPVNLFTLKEPLKKLVTARIFEQTGYLNKSAEELRKEAVRDLKSQGLTNIGELELPKIISTAVEQMPALQIGITPQVLSM